MNLRMQKIDFGDVLKTEEIQEVHTIITPCKISKERDGMHRTKIKTLQTVKIVFVGRVETEIDKYRWLSAVTKMMDEFLIDGGILYKEHKWPCMATETLSGAEAGYSEELLLNTPEVFLGGFAATFWID